MIYPLPFTAEITIECDYIPDLIEIFDFSGRKLLSEESPAELIQLNTTMLAPGIYLVKVSGPGNKWHILRAVKAAQ
jgi:hypothetical protein